MSRAKPIRVFVVRSGEIRDRLVDFATHLPLTDPLVEVVFFEHSPQRTLEQNGLAWRIVTCIADQVWPDGEHHERETWWLYLKREFFGPEFVTLPDGSVVEAEPRSRWRNTKEFSEWVEYLFQFAAEHEVVLPHDVAREQRGIV